MKRESNTLKLVMAAIGRGASRIFRNSVGMAWQGVECRMPNGDLLLKNPRRVRFGLCEGSSDTIGWHSVTITPEMVGQRVAVFVALECKSDTGRASDEQKNFVAAVQRAGGIGAIVRSADEARTAIENGSTRAHTPNAATR